ncbi:MAG: cytoplasmic iron level regulating protein YaaA (DUF328/UPF0246 family) [Rickettsiales bacterium]|jgi:cytoplasmic iron level regulating protein YaaA (DUF328/UPF0246 family)
MFIIISPAKSLNFESKIPPIKTTTPVFIKEIKELINNFNKLSALDLEKLMKISPNLAELNFSRFQNFSENFTTINSKPALFLFDGDVYKSIDVENYDEKDLEFAQNHLRILSGLYGILRPLDLMQGYRLEMGTKSKNIIGTNLPEFWQDKIADFFNKELKNQIEPTIINLASSEYFDAVDFKKINGKIINIIFKEKKGDSYKIIGIFAKKARGLMADFIIKNKVEKSEDLKGFKVGNYRFRSELSDNNNFHFYR